MPELQTYERRLPLRPGSLSSHDDSRACPFLQLLDLPEARRALDLCGTRSVQAAIGTGRLVRLPVRQESHPPPVLPELRNRVLRDGARRRRYRGRRRQCALPRRGGDRGAGAHALRRQEPMTEGTFRLRLGALFRGAGLDRLPRLGARPLRQSRDRRLRLRLSVTAWSLNAASAFARRSPAASPPGRRGSGPTTSSTFRASAPSVKPR